MLEVSSGKSLDGFAVRESVAVHFARELVLGQMIRLEMSKSDAGKQWIELTVAEFNGR